MGKSDAECPQCGILTSQSPCSNCGYEFPDLEKELIVKELKSQIKVILV